MEFTISQSILQSALKRVQGAVSNKGTVPILANVLIETSNNGVAIYATNLDISISGEYEASVKTQGKITVLANKLFDISKA